VENVERDCLQAATGSNRSGTKRSGTRYLIRVNRDHGKKLSQ